MRLKPCPFCGSEADIECQGESAWAVECMNENCGVFLPIDSWYISRENAIKAWNTRPTEHAILTSGKVKEPQWPDKRITHSETHILLGTYHLTQEICSAEQIYGYNKAIDDCKQAWKDAQG